MLCFILTYLYRILIFMNIFGYFFQKVHFKGSSEKRTHQQKLLGGGGGWGLTTPLPPALDGLFDE